MENSAGRLSLRGVRAGYVGADVLQGVDLEVEPGALTVLLGPNGAGKSTLIKAIFGLLSPRQGTIELDGERIDGSTPAEVARKRVALVPEGRHLFTSESIADNLWLGGWVRGSRGNVKAELAADRDAMYERFPVLGKRRKEAAGSLSGGEAQMLAIAMGLMARPSVLLLDEPSLGLAPRLVSEVMDLAKELAAEGVTVLLIEQMVTKALAVADYVAVLGRGRVTVYGTPEEVAGDPAIKAAYLG